ncbi:MAG: DUF2231 domain-containing protein [Pseudomonadota bacterium]|nr:DUF2231 domain-containing protein [Pseudomonadota bacterium]
MELAGAEAQIEGRLFGRQEGTPFLGPRRSGDIVIHCNLAQPGGDWPRPQAARDGALQPAGRGSKMDGSKIEPLRGKPLRRRWRGASDRGSDYSEAVRHMAANLMLVLLEAANLLLRLGNPGFVASTGIYLSGIAVLILLYSGWKGGELVFRHGIGVLDEHSR